MFLHQKYEIKEGIAELRSKQLPDYKPNYQGIINVYVLNTARLLKIEYRKRKNKVAAEYADGIVNINSANIMTASYNNICDLSWLFH